MTPAVCCGDQPHVATAFGLEREPPIMSDGDTALSVADLVDYCRTQARLLAGRAETISAETDELLDEIDADIAEIRSRMETHRNGPETPTASSPTAGPDEPDAVAALEERERELAEKQAVAEAKHARMAAFQDLSEAYVELADELEGTVEDGQEALGRVVRFERDRDATAYFDDQLTVLEAVAENNDESA